LHTHTHTHTHARTHVRTHRVARNHCRARLLAEIDVKNIRTDDDDGPRNETKQTGDILSTDTTPFYATASDEFPRVSVRNLYYQHPS